MSIIHVRAVLLISNHVKCSWMKELSERSYTGPICKSVNPVCVKAVLISNYMCRGETAWSKMKVELWVKFLNFFCNVNVKFFWFEWKCLICDKELMISLEMCCGGADGETLQTFICLYIPCA